MKKMTICLALLMALLMTGSAMAAASVTYEGGAENFVFLPGSEYTDTDMFENFKNVLPGDVLTQIIPVQNTSGKQVRIYMRAEPVSEADRDFLSQLKLHVECRATDIFDAAASETAQLTENTLLGVFNNNGSTQLYVTLTVPADLGNEYMGKVGIVPWTFLVEEVPVDDTPDTGDWFQMGVWASIAAVLAAAIVVVLIAQRKRQTAENE